MESDRETVYARLERGRNFLRLVGVSALWCVLLVPIVTFGPATVAMYHAILKTVRGGEGKFFPEFFASFKKNFKRTAPVGTVYLLLALLLAFNILVSNRFAVQDPTQWTFLSYIYTFLLLLLGVIGCFLFPVFTHTEEKAAVCVKYGLALTFKHLFTAITCFLVLFLLAFVILYLPACLLILPGLGCMILSMVLEAYLDKELGVAYRTVSEKTRKAQVKKKPDLSGVFPDLNETPAKQASAPSAAAPSGAKNGGAAAPASSGDTPADGAKSPVPAQKAD